ncbi:helix-turn-helix domain-containing protein [Limosilactobacillus reuteri]|uniref:Helix-turn-helix domain-containing protein n=1 Tax=Limosilactobacillus reuteri TaxID=1598 RepID=A0AAW4X496_LIMRT|nr:helix-turn-helix transcriptional regulator [Limosilactobacillus reuteri]PEH07705.1 transcriptional regulator [Lactobacillus sp. UMNPBX3]MBC6911152.1 helix-turn-helix domain-containing protein [Limosilactobacillus reuteri]MCC4477211.1 helix-turn-helix domain-containing protein [Limosilactobacillus reuteri]MCC4479368.1 helix-turn-helix domain-containing protein [Limosilactobacillus reuteri]MCC4481563.1 helix-turn-helix domain-containing protein [Limosilactobacillus reuteri]
MRLRGDVLKQIRRKRGLSQTALAEGICTQATISLMEKQNRLPKMDILTAICERLNISSDRIVENEVSGINETFNQIVDNLISRNFEDASALLKKVHVKNLESDFDKQRYYYLVGMVQVESNQIDEAIFNFELVLTQFATTSANIYLAMTTAGMALAYLKRGDKERAARLTNRSVKLIDNKKLIGSLYQWASIDCQIAELYLQLEDPDNAIEVANKGIELCREHDSLFLLDELYLYIGRSYILKNDKEEAKKALKIAESLSIARNGSVAEDTILLELKNLEI